MDLPSKVLYGVLLLIPHCCFPVASDENVKDQYAKDAHYAVCEAEKGIKEVLSCLSYLLPQDTNMIKKCMTETVLEEEYDEKCVLKQLIKKICTKDLEIIKQGYYHTCDESEKRQEQRTRDEKDGLSDFKTCILKMVEDARLEKDLLKR